MKLGVHGFASSSGAVAALDDGCGLAGASGDDVTMISSDDDGDDAAVDDGGDDDDDVVSVDSEEDDEVPDEMVTKSLSSAVAAARADAILAGALASPGSLPLWSLATAKLWQELVPLESRLRQAKPLVCFHDCAGIGGAAEGWRWLRAAGALVSAPHVVALSDVDPRCRAFLLSTHPWPTRVFDDMCQRPGGMTHDLLTDMEVGVPQSELYEAGFPCQPWSLRRGSRTACFEEPKAQPYYAVLREIESGRHDAVCLENVMGLFTRRYKGERVIDIVERALRRAAGDIYFLCISPSISPHTFGEMVHRPRVIIRLIRKSRALINTEDEFAARLRDIEVAIAQECAARARHRQTNFIDILEHMGAHSIDVDRMRDAPCSDECRCSKPVSAKDGGKVNCSFHPCRCKPCRAGDAVKCTWVKEHATHWAKLIGHAEKKTSYMTEAARRGLPVESTFTTPRQINMAELIHRKLLTKGVDIWSSPAVYDTSQAYGYHALRTDGLLPTLTRSGRLVPLAWGEALTPFQLFLLMGFPKDLAKWAVQEFSASECQQFLGNTLHPTVAGVCNFSLMCLMKADRAL